MIIGPALDASLIEVGYYRSEHFAALVVHAMRARAEYLQLLDPPKE